MRTKTMVIATSLMICSAAKSGKRFFLILLGCLLSMLPVFSQDAGPSDQEVVNLIAGTWKFPENFTDLNFVDDMGHKSKTVITGNIELKKDKNFEVDFKIEDPVRYGVNVVSLIVDVAGKGKYEIKDGKIKLYIYSHNLSYNVSYSSDIIDEVELQKLEDYMFSAMNNMKESLQKYFFDNSHRDWVWENEPFELKAKGKQLVINGKTLKLKKKAK